MIRGVRSVLGLLPAQEHGIDLFEQDFQIDGLGMVFVAAGFESLGPVPTHGMGRQGDDRDGVEPLPEGPRDRPAVDQG